MTEEQLTRLEKLEAEATPGHYNTLGDFGFKNWQVRSNERCLYGSHGFSRADAELIAAMRNALPELLKEIRELRKSVAFREELIRRLRPQ